MHIYLTIRNIWDRFVRTENLLLSALLISVTLLIAYQGVLWRIDQYLYDTRNSLLPRQADDEILIVAIDEASLKKLGNLPWPAEYHDRVIRRLSMSGARSVSMTDPAEIPVSSQQPVAELVSDELRNFTTRGLKDHINQQKVYGAGYGKPVYSLFVTSDYPWQANVIQDADGIVRSFALAGKYHAGQWSNPDPLHGNSDEYNHAGADPGASGDYLSSSGYRYSQYMERIYIPFSGPSGQYHRVSYHDVLNQKIRPELFRDKTVLIGATAPGTGRSYPTSVSGFLNPMPEVEITANIVDAVKSGMQIRPVSMAWYLAFSGMFALIPFFIFPFFSPRGNVVVTLLLATSAVCISLLLITIIHVWLPPAAALLAVIISYSLWSSRRLENTVHFLGRELSRLNVDIGAREKELTSRLGSAFTFLESILPLKGWYIADSEGVVKYTHGQKPGLSVTVPANGNWNQNGSELWTYVVENRQELEVGMRWATPGGPTAREKAFLDGYIAQSLGEAENTDHEAIEVVERLTTQVQKAIVNLHDIHQFFDDSFAQMADGVLVTNNQGKIIFANERAAIYLQGHKISNPEGKDVTGLLDNLKLCGDVSCNNLLRDAYLERETVSTNARNLDGLDLLLQISPLLSRKTGISGVIITISDISYIKSVERARNETLSFVSHDLRSPLVSILALLEMSKASQSPEELRQLHRRIEEYTQLTISMAEQFIQLAHVESDPEIRLVAIDLKSTAINAYEQVWYQAQSRKINMVREIELDNAWVLGDASLLERAITNLLNNAIKYSPEGRTVHMRLFREDGKIHCCVSDEGYGIPEDELPGLFERFSRAHLNSGVDEQGIGLGLALVKATAERHGGNVEVTSREGEGSRFCLIVPATELNEQAIYDS